MTVITRHPQAVQRQLPEGVGAVGWDDEGRWRDQVAGADVVVNLAGATISRRWTRAYRQRILESRLRATRSIADAMAGVGRPQVLITASAVGYYGSEPERTLTEDDGPGHDFLATVAAQWEAAAQAVASDDVRVVRLRIGTVLGVTGGALPRLLLPLRLGLGGPLGSGKQWLSWIHLDDLVRLILFAAETPALAGPVNATAPHPVTNEEFTRVLARLLGRPAWLRVPGWLLRLVLGEMATLLLEGQRVLPVRALAAGFDFRFPELEPALRDLLSRPPARGAA